MATQRWPSRPRTRASVTRACVMGWATAMSVRGWRRSKREAHTQSPHRSKQKQQKRQFGRKAISLTHRPQLARRLIPIMAPRVTPTSNDADNPSGSNMPAACSDWRFDDADSMSARANTSPLQMPDIRLQAYPKLLWLMIKLLFWERSPYTRVSRPLIHGYALT